MPERHKLGSSGSIIPNLEVKICDDQGNELPIGQHGEIVVSGENVMVGYWKNEKATRETLRDGWLFTGDLGYLDSDNFLYVLGRAKSLLIGHDGEKYSPEGIEEAIVGNSRTIDQVINPSLARNPAAACHPRVSTTSSRRPSSETLR